MSDEAEGPRCVNCRNALDLGDPAVRREGWMDGYGGTIPTGRHWCGPACYAMTVAIEGGRRASLVILEPDA